MCRNHSSHGWYNIWAKSQNYDVIKFWAENSKKIQNCCRNLKLDSNDAECQADSEKNIICQHFVQK